MRSLLFLITCFLSCSAAAEENFLLINGLTNETLCALGPHIEERISPCSTFKIPLSLMGYDACILQDENIPTWAFQEGYDDFLIQWKAPQTPKSWMEYSCIWYSKVLAFQLGKEKICSYLTLIDYGNQHFSGALPWVNGSLKISPKEQVTFLQKLLQGTLPVSEHALNKTKHLLFKEEFNGWKLFGKTGWSGSDITLDGQTLEHAWFIGWIEQEDLFFPFAYLIKDKKISLEQRIPRVKQLILESLPV